MSTYGEIERLYNEAKSLLADQEYITTTYIQSKLQIGNVMAGMLLDGLIRDGYVSDKPYEKGWKVIKKPTSK